MSPTAYPTPAAHELIATPRIATTYRRLGLLSDDTVPERLIYRDNGGNLTLSGFLGSSIAAASA